MDNKIESDKFAYAFERHFPFCGYRWVVSIGGQNIYTEWTKASAEDFCNKVNQAFEVVKRAV